MKKQIAVIGCGAAGLMAAFSAASSADASVTVFDGNEKPGKKIYITGKGRCNFTNMRPPEEFLSGVVTNPRFLYSSIYSFTPQDAADFFEESGCRVKTERGQRAFPLSDRASDITAALVGRCRSAGVDLVYRKPVADILTDDGRVTGVAFADGGSFRADAVICCTGGLSYPSTGSTGAGYRMAAALGHSIAGTSPSLVPFNIAESFCRELQGLSLKNVNLTMLEKGRKKPVFSGLGEMLFTHFGVSGPLVLSASAFYHREAKTGLVIDLKPALTEEQLDARLIRELEENRGKAFKNAVSSLFPAKLLPVMVGLSGIPADKRAGEIDRGSRQAFCRLIKHLELTVAGTRGFEEAVITRGGISVKEIDPSTMESKLVRGLYFAGEIIDVDALTGGYNLQIAWSTGHLAGMSAGAALMQKGN